jgi:hypothetical protein
MLTKAPVTSTVTDALVKIANVYSIQGKHEEALFEYHRDKAERCID